MKDGRVLQFDCEGEPSLTYVTLPVTVKYAEAIGSLSLLAIDTKDNLLLYKEEKVTYVELPGPVRAISCEYLKVVTLKDGRVFVLDHVVGNPHDNTHPYTVTELSLL